MTCLLFTGGGGAGNEAIWRLWRDRYELHFADLDPDAFAASLPRERCHAIPAANDPAFASEISGLCNRLDVDVMIPGVDEELPHMAAVATLTRAKILAPEPSFISTMLDKLESMHRLAALGIDVPRTVPIGDAAQVGFPCVIKPRSGRGSRGFAEGETAEQVAAYSVLHRTAPHTAVAQEKLVGQEFTVLLAADGHRRLHAIVPVRVLVKRGITLRAVVDADDRVVSACKAIHERWPQPGCYNIQLMLTSDGRVRPFEINPRISTTFCLGIAAGIDPVAIFLGEASETIRNGLLPFANGITLRRFWTNDVQKELGNEVRGN